MRTRWTLLSPILFLTACDGVGPEPEPGAPPIEMNRSAIIDGTQTSLRPEVGVLWDSNANESCAATLINQRFVLTASHCVGFSSQNPTYYTFNFTAADGGPRSFPVSRIYNLGPDAGHTLYGDQAGAFGRLNLRVTADQKGNNDIALAVLASAVPSADAVPATLATSFPQPRCYNIPGFGWVCSRIATTFGFSYTDCVHLSGGGYKQYKTWIYTDPDAYGRHSNHVICSGDSGGPGFEGYASERGAIWGVSSTAGTDVYGNVVAFKSQIDSTISAFYFSGPGRF
jgi:hypothetical protein